MTKISKIKFLTMQNIYKEKKIYGNSKTVILEIETNNGIKGYGETYLSVYRAKEVKIFVNHIKDKIINKNINEIDQIIFDLEEPFITQVGFAKSVISSVEIALYDILSKHKKIPLCKLLNRNSKESVLAYCSSGPLSYSSKILKKDTKEVVTQGFKAYKMRIGLNNWSSDLERIHSAKKSLGNAKLMIDAIMGSHKKKWNLKTAKKKIFSLKNVKPFWIEEPLYPFDLNSYSKLKSSTRTEIAFGECFSNYEQFEYSCDYNCCTFLQPDVTLLGIRDFIKVNKLAGKFKKKIAIHVWGSPLSLMISLHMALACKNVSFIEVPRIKHNNFLKFSKIFKLDRYGKIKFANLSNLKGIGYRPSIIF